jgi:hypothetical protein
MTTVLLALCFCLSMMALHWTAAHSGLALTRFAPNAQPLEDQGPIHVLDKVAFEEIGDSVSGPLTDLPAWNRGATLNVVQRAYRLKQLHPDWYLPEQVTDQDWRQSLVFVRVVLTLSDTLSLEPEIVRRGSRLVEDLGAE